MQIVARDSIDKPLTFNICLLQLIFHTSVFTSTYACKGAFNPNIRQIPPRVCTLVLFIMIATIDHYDNCQSVSPLAPTTKLPFLDVVLPSDVYSSYDSDN